ncbi:hypothetical protein BS47DRAFT_339884 [Hydnum rufescens UP504]|uniref:Peptidase A1 domain-containing protein n=1 Tax=Hydnum rufescens UP504 TaxID=1448309 RepID=A0A9P6DLS2_9AGAM|nr:hypothetical protein BS47DRAFT_339884 [Hydnum rufescens UP504]
MKTFLLCFVLPLVAGKNLLPFRRTSAPRFPRSHGTIGARGTKRGTVDLSDYHDLLYIANVTVGSSTYPVQLDSGSSDLVIFSTVSGATTSSLTVNITYGTGYAYGSISNASVAFGGLTVSQQALLASTSFSDPVTSLGAEGILGLGTHVSMSIPRFPIAGEAGVVVSFTTQFAQTPTEPNFITFALTRSEDATALDQGGFTIGVIDPAYTNVQSTNAISTWPVSNPDRWSILLDAYELSNGTVPVSSSVTNVPSGKAVLLLDTGTSYMYAPSAMVTAVYGNIKGAQFDSSAAQWNVPYLVVQSLSDSTKCVGSIVPQDLAAGGGEFDILAGDVFLRNVYTVFDFGDFASQSNLTMGNPYVKLLSTTNITAASLEFDKLRVHCLPYFKRTNDPHTGTTLPKSGPHQFLGSCT